MGDEEHTFLMEEVVLMGREKEEDSSWSGFLVKSLPFCR